MIKTHNAIIRGESLFKSDLSDMCGVEHVTDYCEDVQIQIMQIATGKTNNLKTLYGRCMRHRNKNLCPIGASGIFLPIQNGLKLKCLSTPWEQIEKNRWKILVMQILSDRPVNH